MPNVFSQSYQLHQSISVIRVVGIFRFYSNFKRNFCKQTVENLIVAFDLVLHCLPMSHKEDARLVWVNVRNCLMRNHIHFLRNSFRSFIITNNFK